MAKDKTICSVDKCNRPSIIRGLCGKHYQRHRKHGITDGNDRAETNAGRRFLMSINKTDECVAWPFAVLPNGYGSAYLNGRTIGAHRLSFILNVRELESGEYVLHSCDNPICVNPAHLRSGSAADNMRDKHDRGRQRYLKGEECEYRKLDAADVIEIRRIYQTGVSQAKIGKQFGISQPHVGEIVRRVVWKHV